jgi:hypothetical protein
LSSATRYIFHEIRIKEFWQIDMEILFGSPRPCLPLRRGKEKPGSKEQERWALIVLSLADQRLDLGWGGEETGKRHPWAS